MIKTVKYLDLSNCSLPKEVSKEFEHWAKYDEPHNNGYAVQWRVEKQNEAEYPAINQYFIDQGVEVGDFVVVHSQW